MQKQPTPIMLASSSKAWHCPGAYCLGVIVEGIPAEVLNALRKKFFEQYHLQEASKSLWVPLAVLHVPAEQLDTYGRWLQRLVATIDEFTLQLNNFSGVPPHQVHMRVVQSSSFQSLCQRILAFTHQVAQFSEGQVQPFNRWSLSLIESIPGMLFDKALQHFAHQELFLEVPVNQLALYELNGYGQPCKLIQTLRLATRKQMPTKQWFAPSLSAFPHQ